MLELFQRPESEKLYDEFFVDATQPRPEYARLARTLATFERSDLVQGVAAINAALLRRGVTFTVYAETSGTERIFPFDPIPRIFTHERWQRVALGIAQRVRALNAFLRDVYHERRILREGRTRARSCIPRACSRARWSACGCRTAPTSTSVASI